MDANTTVLEDEVRTNESGRQTNFNSANAVLLCVIGAASVVFGLWWEGYLHLVRWPFALYGALAFGLAFWFVSFELSTRRFIWLAIVASCAGYLTQVIGSTIQSVWVYPPGHTYGFVRGMFVIAATLAYGLTVMLLAPLARKLVPLRSRKANFVVVGLLFVVFIATSAEYRESQTAVVWAYYGFLFVFAMYAAAMMNLATLLGLIASAIMIGGISETLGASSGLWTFVETGTFPPAYLLFASWPVEILFHYGASGMLARESLVSRPRYFRERVLYEPQPNHEMWCGDNPLTVAAVESEDPLAALDEVLDRCGFFDVVNKRRREVDKPAAELEIAIKPNFMFMYSASDRSTFTDPALVEHLIDRLRERGYTRIAVVEAQSAYGNFFQDRNVANVARVVGYRPEGRYRIVDLTEERVVHQFSGTLGQHVVGPTWRDADVRISFAKNKTHTWAWYTLCIKNIYGALAMQNKIREYHYKREIYSPTIDMLIDFPVHFGLIDAYRSADGPFGIFADRRPNETNTILGGENIVAVDWVGATKMGLDPMVSRYMQLATQAFGKPDVRWVGSKERYRPWDNVPKPIVDFWDQAEESYGFTNTVFSIGSRHYMSDEFRPKPMARVWLFVARLLAPLGGLVYKRKEP